MRPHVNTFRRRDWLLLAGGVVLAPGLALGAGQRVQAMIELSEPPAVQTWVSSLASGGHAAGAEVQAAAATVAHLQRLEASQQRLLATLAAPGLGASVLYRIQRVLNGIAVDVEADWVPELAALPGVKRVTRLVPEELDLFSSVPLLNAPQTWTSPGVTGQGVRIGIIDSGVDYLHVGLGGSGSYAGQDYADAAVPWNAKVVGGYDFAGDLYNAGCTDAQQSAGTCSRTPVPDPDPMDCNGHGTHVAGIAAGYGVTTQGTTYPGPYSTATNFAALQVGPGVAPGAQLYALRVFGCSGSSNLTAAAIEWAMDPDGDGNFSDHLDVINLSLGSSYGQADAASTVAATNAALAGVIVVAAAGNSGDVYYIVGSPAVADRVISVANSVDSTQMTGGFGITTPASLAGIRPAAEASFGPNLSTTGAVTADLVLANDGTGTTSDACEALANAGAVSGKIALVDRGTCTSAVKVKNCQTAGATGVLVADNAQGWPSTMTGTDATITIPSMLTDLATGNALKVTLAGGTVNVTLTAANRGTVRAAELPMVDTLSSSSSRGPGFATSALKPDLTAPGTTIVSLANRSGSGWTSMSGTSMACPHIAGAMALLRQLHPDWTVEELKASILGTSTNNLFASPNHGLPTYGPARVGAGRTDLEAATGPTLLAYGADTPGAVSVSFGRPEVVGSWSATRTVSLVNKGASATPVTLQLQTVVDMPGVTFSLPGGTLLNVPAHGSATFAIGAAAEGPQMKHSRDASVAVTVAGNPRHWVSEEAAYLVISAPGQPTQRLGVYAAPRPASTMGTQESNVSLTAATGNFSLHLAGQGVSTGSSFPTDWVSLVSAFELAATSPDEALSTGSGQFSDLRYIGVTSDYAAQVAAGHGLAETSIWFGIATWADWASPNATTVLVLIDTNRDGTDDYSLTSTSTGGSSPTDVYTVQLCKLPSGSCNGVHLNGVDAGVRDTALLGTNVMVLPVLPGWLGLAPGASRFNYKVLTPAEYTDPPTLTYDPAHPGLSFGGTSFLGATTTQPLYTDLAGQTIPVQYNRADYLANASSGLLLLHHFNQAASRAQVVTVVSPCAPTCTATVPPTAMLGVPVQLQGAVSGQGCGGNPTWDWDFGDDTPHGTVANPSHTYTANGTFTWRLAVTLDGVVCTRSGQIGVSKWTAIVPSVAHSQGSLGSQWRTDLAVVNRGATPADVTLTYIPYTAQSEVKGTATLAAGETQCWKDVLVSLFGFAAADSPKGSVKIEANARLLVTSRTYNKQASGSFGQSYPALTVYDGFDRDQMGIVGQLVKSTAFRSNLGVVNLGNADAAFIVTLHDASGAQLGNPLGATVGAGKYFQWDKVFDLAKVGNTPLAYARVRTQTAGASVWAYGSVIDNTTNDPTTVAAIWDETAGPYMVPSTAHAGGSGGSQWRTDLVAVSPRSASELTLTYTPVEGGSGASVTRPGNLPALATSEWEDVLVSLFGFATTATPKGTVSVTSTQPVYLFARTYNRAGSGTYGQSYPSLRASDGIGVGQEGIVPQLEKSAEFRSNLGVQNLGGAACSLAVRLHGPTGAQVGSTLTRSVGAGRYYQWDDVLGKAQAGDQALAYATVQVQTTGCRAWAYGSLVDNITNDPTTIPLLMP
ncbi:MAG TPA: S8 family serine peptidase [Thermoanaerobaculaceae bacterium]|nr:S8 family serine peptidase [Thermoanaerobaculaceae bacterium]